MRFWLAFLSCSWLCASARAEPRELVLLFTSDMHSQLEPRRVREPDGVHERGGVARLATLIARERARHPDATLLVDAGDFAMGTPFHTRFREQAYELRHLARLGYDAVTFGNHDFDFMPAGLASAMVAALDAKELPPLVAANIRFPEQPDPGAKALLTAFRRGGVAPYRVFTRAGYRIGVFGVLGHDAAGDAPFAKPITFDDAVATSRRMVDELRKRQGVDLVIALSHGGTAPPPAVSEDEELARKVPGIDVIVSGHSHRALTTPVRVGQTSLVRAGSSLANLGALVLVRRGSSFVSKSHELLAIDERVPAQPEVEARVATERAEVEASYFARYGRSSNAPLAEFGFVPERLDALPTHPGELALGDLVTDAYAFAIARAERGKAPPVDVVFHPLGHLRDSFRRGPVGVGDVFSVLSLGLGIDDTPGYPLVAFWVSGAELRDMLEVEATVAPQKRTAHLQVSGVRFSFNPHRLPTDRVRDVFVQERRLDDARTYRVAMNYYVASRLDFMEKASRGLLSATPRDQRGRVIRDFRSARIDADPDAPGVQELKEWQALAHYLESFPDLTHDGLPDVPGRYARPEGRFGPRPSFAPSALVGSPHGLTKLALLLLLAASLGALAFGMRRRRSPQR